MAYFLNADDRNFNFELCITELFHSPVKMCYLIPREQKANHNSPVVLLSTCTNKWKIIFE